MKLKNLFRKLKTSIPYRPITWANVAKRKHICLYAGDLPGIEGYEKFVGLSLRRRNRCHLRHAVTEKIPLPDNSVEMFQAEDVFEHIPFAQLPPVIAEIHRVLKPGGLFRLGLPDYRCDVLFKRSIKDEQGRIVFDPKGGGRFVDGEVADRGHVWFPTFETARELVGAAPFRVVDFRHYYDEQGRPVTNPIDYTKSHVKRTPDHDRRVQNPYRPMSIVVDCYK